MKAVNLINNDVPPIRPYETMDKALFWMDEFKVKHLPVVEGSQYLGLLSDEMVLDHNKPKDLINVLNFIGKKQCVTEKTHLYKVMHLLSKHKLTLIPVVKDETEFLGAISSIYLMGVLSKQSGFSEKGPIIVLQLNSIDFQLSQIAQIIEGNNAKILGFYTEFSNDENQLNVTLKINQTKLGGILQTFSRYDYNVIGLYTDEEDENDFQERYDHLMNYLKL